MIALAFRVELDWEDDGRVVAEVVSEGFEGVIAYGGTVEEAMARVARLALAVFFDLLAAGELVLLPV